jgi:hypothetical protein
VISVEVTKADLTSQTYRAAEYINIVFVFKPAAKKFIRETLDGMG